MPTIDLLASLLFFALLAGCAAAHLIRLRLSGAVHYARVNAAGGTPLLSMRAMEFGYWCLQPLQKPALRLGLTANAVTGISLALGILAGAAIAFGHFGIGALLAALSAVGDGLDGLIARATKSSSPGGALFDASVDRYTEFFLLGGLAFQQRESAPMLGLALLALLGSFMISYGSAKAEAMRVPVPRGMMRRAERAVYLCSGLFLSPIAAALFGHAAGIAPIAFALFIVAFVSNASAAIRLRQVARAAAPKLAPRAALPEPTAQPQPVVRPAA